MLDFLETGFILKVLREIVGAFCLIAYKEPLYCVNVPRFPQQESKASAIQRLFVFGECASMSKELPLTRGLSALVDDSDFEWLSKIAWHANKQQNYFEGCWRWVAIHRTSRLQGRKDIQMHRMITGAPPGKVVDHINGNTLDNRRCNLRICDQAQNSRNLRKRSSKTSSLYKGVFFDTERQTWVAAIQIDNKQIRLGRFDSQEEAAQAYDQAAIIHHGEFAKLNFQQKEKL